MTACMTRGRLEGEVEGYRGRKDRREGQSITEERNGGRDSVTEEWRDKGKDSVLLREERLEGQYYREVEVGLEG